jgi:hypothetical protein
MDWWINASPKPNSNIVPLITMNANIPPNIPKYSTGSNLARRIVCNIPTGKRAMFEIVDQVNESTLLSAVVMNKIPINDYEKMELYNTHQLRVLIKV